MKKINLNYNEDLNVDEIINEIKTSKVGKQIIKELLISDEEIKNNYELLSNYIKYNADCSNCSSMGNCTHSTKGHIYGIKRDMYGDLTDYFAICDLYKSYYKRKENLLLTTFDIEELLDESQKNFVLDNPQLLGFDFIKKIIKLQKNEKVDGAFLKINNAKIRLKLIKSLAYGLLLNHKVTIVKFSDFLKIIKSEFKVKDGPTAFKTAMESDVLIIDGIGNEAISIWSRDDILLSLLDNRQQMDKTTILTSEYEIEDLKKLYKLGYNDDIKVNQLIEKIKDIK